MFVILCLPAPTRRAEVGPRRKSGLPLPLSGFGRASPVHLTLAPRPSTLGPRLLPQSRCLLSTFYSLLSSDMDAVAHTFSSLARMDHDFRARAGVGALGEPARA